MKKFLLASLLLFIPLLAEAQQTVNVASLPTTVNVAWDDSNLATAAVTSYRWQIDNAAPVNLPSTKPTPCTSCGTASFQITTTGTHTFTLNAVNSIGPSDPVQLQFIVAITVTAKPISPSNLVITIGTSNPPPPPPPPGGASLTTALPTVARGSSISLTVAGVTNPTVSDWVGLFTPTGTSEVQVPAGSGVFVYVSSCGRAPAATARTGATCSLPIPQGVTPGSYQLRLYPADMYTGLLKSVAITVN